jgi:hypothetical protein
MENFEHSKWMGKNAQAKAAREFSWEQIARHTEGVYYELLNLQDAPRSTDQDAGCPLAHTLLKERPFQMGVHDGDPLVGRGLSILKLVKLAVASLGGDGVLTWMGNEFGQIDPVDMPRPGNGYNEDFCRIKYELAENSELKFKQMEMFEMYVNRLAKACKWLSHPEYKLLAQSEAEKVLVYARGGCIFVFNFHPVGHYQSYSFQVPKAVADVSGLRCVLDSDGAQFGGSAPTAAEEKKKRGLLAKSGDMLTVDIPPRTAFVFAALADEPFPEASQPWLGA